MTAILLAEILLPPSDKIACFVALIFYVTRAELSFPTACLENGCGSSLCSLTTPLPTHISQSESRDVQMALYQKGMGRANRVSATVIFSQDIVVESSRV